MRINAINYSYQKPTLNNSASKALKSKKTSQPDLTQDTVSFKGKYALKGAAIMGITGSVIGAICSGGTSVLAAALLFGICNGFIGAVFGSHMDENNP